MHRFDIVIIGSGMGGLVCGDLLSREGYQVCIIEKNKQLGGCLQSFSRDKRIFESGVHYIGGLEKGQNLYRIFDYLGLMEKLHLERINEDAFDKIIIGDDPKVYSLAQGWDQFYDSLLRDFPGEEPGLKKYRDTLRGICLRFPLYNLRSGGSFAEKTEAMEVDTERFIKSCTENEKLRAVLGGNNILYAGRGNETPLYVHALIQNHYIESSWKCLNGGSQIGKFLAANIRERGGVILRNTEVKKIVGDGKEATHVTLADGNVIYAAVFISNLHPMKTLEMLEGLRIKPAYQHRLESLKNTVSSFTLNIVLKKNTVPYQSSNTYFHKEGKLWSLDEYTQDNWPLGYGVFFTPQRDNHQWAESVSIITYMHFEEVEQWGDTFNTTLYPSERTAEYQEFKKLKEEKLLDCVAERFPGIRENIEAIYSATPLSYRDYIGNDDGSLYGIAKDYREPLKTLIPPRTHVSNLFLTGQNLNLHGILGATISALSTTTAVMGNDSVVEKIRNAENA
ncbi:NAD(P)/FAD-dependent oxidoreductase [Pollutibacter soli]|uniref:phytoene desaturase family protein n=1 Tax=Pollutibacter soli TaxID=3034157 RepID=UPI003013DE23